MAISVICPSCDEKLSVSEELRGKKILCRECGKSVPVPGGKVGAAARDGATRETPPRDGATRDADDSDFIEEKRRKPVKPAARRFRGEDEDDEDDDDGDEDRPRRAGASAGGSQKTALIAAIGGGLVIVIGVALFLILRGGGTPASNTNSSPVAQNPPDRQPDPVVQKKEEEPKTEPEPKKEPEEPAQKDPPKKDPEPEPAPVVNAPKGSPALQSLLKSTVWIEAGPAVDLATRPTGKDSGTSTAPKAANYKSFVIGKWAGEEKKASVRIECEFFANNTVTKKDSVGQTVTGSWNINGNAITLTFSGAIYNGTFNLPGTTMAGTAVGAKLSWDWVLNKELGGGVIVQPNTPAKDAQPPKAALDTVPSILAGTWTGIEKGVVVDYVFKSARDVTKTESKKLIIEGTYSLVGNILTVTFAAPAVTCKGNVNATDITGDATGGAETWKWALKKVQEASARPKFPGGKGKGNKDIEDLDGDVSGAISAAVILYQGKGGRPGIGGQGGAQGAFGVQGAFGAQGQFGAQGAFGVQGGKGAFGAQGAAGAQGAFGAQGGAAGTPTAPPKPETVTGSGVLVDMKHRLVLTSLHIVGNDPQVIKIHFPELDAKGDLITHRDFYKTKAGVIAKIVAQDDQADLALLQLESLPENAKAMPLAKLSSPPAAPVHSMGNPSAEKTLWRYAQGNVRQVLPDKWKAINPHTYRMVNYEATKVTTDTALNPGDSGGPLMNERGCLVGVTHGGDAVLHNTSYCIDVGECRALIEKYYATHSETWAAEPEPVENTGNPGQTSDLIKKLADQDAKVRVQAAETLGKLGVDSSTAFGPLFNLLKDGDEGVRRAAAEALALVPPRSDDVNMLVNICEDENEPLPVRLQAAKDVGKLGPQAKSAVPALMAMVKGANDELRRAGLVSLQAIVPDAKHAPELAKALKSGSLETKRLALDVLIRMGPDGKKALPEITGVLKSGDRAMKIQAAKSINAMGPAGKEAISALVEALKDAKEAEREVGMQAASALFKLGDGKSTVGFFVGTLKNGSDPQKKAAAYALGELKGEASLATKDLCFALDDDKVRVAAAEALLKIGKSTATLVSQKLNAAIKGNAHGKARLACIEILGQVGQTSKDAAYSLGYAAQYDPLDSNRQAAQAVIKRLTGRE
ncbi:MAG: HEAT repeat domain-containing protein [Planctomycetes bacterium]|nr:HEAT repeat domain-containing protein [Planctomycetota bacterium]